MSLNLSCPSCGGSVDSVEGERTTVCPYCQSLLCIEGDRGVFTVMLRNNLDDPRARRSLAKWFSRGLKARDLPAKAKVTEVYPIYIPFWRLVARAAGWVCGYRIDRYTDREGRTHTKKVPLEEMVFRDFEWTGIACDPGDIGVTRLPGTGGVAVSHQDGDIPTFEATSSSDDARAQGTEDIQRRAVASAHVPNITFQKMQILPRYLSLIFYPVWMCRYTYQGRTYFATLDGIRGDSLSGRAPGDPLYQSLVLVGGVTVGGLLTGLGVSAMLAGWRLEWVGAGTIAGLVIFGLSFLFFRHGSEITEGEIDSARKGGVRRLLRGVG